MEKTDEKTSLTSSLGCALGLKRQLVGVTFLFDKKEFNTCMVPLSTQSISYCSLVRMATIGFERKAGLKQISCPGATRALGMVPPDEEYLSGRRYLSLGMYNNLECARETATHVARMEREVYGIAVQPLLGCKATPHVVIAICNPNQAMRMVQGRIHGSGPLTPMQGMGMQGLCAELTVRPFLTSDINTSLLCSNTRYTCAWADSELGVAMPYEAFPAVVQGVIDTVNAAEPDSAKDDILKRAKEQDVELNIRKGVAYYCKTPTQETPSTRVRSLSISVRGVHKTHTLKSGSAINALNGVSFDVKDQEFLTLVGPSGCGKSTLLNLMAGLHEPDSGTIMVYGGAVNNHPNLGFISQADTLLSWRTVQKNVEMGLELRKVPPRQRRSISEQLMSQVNLLDFAQSYPFELSGGMKKRVAVIRALAYDPDIIFMDEPFVGLDVQTRDALEEDILNLWHNRRKTIVMVTHDLGEAITLSDRVILFSGRPAQVRAEYEIPLQRPRSVSESKFTEEFISLHKRIWQDLSAEVLAEADGEIYG